jgi:hypothetical protein
MRFDEIVDNYLKTSYFVESPMYYDGVFNNQLEEPTHNKSVALEISKNNEIFSTFKSWNVYKIPDGFDENKFTYCLIKENNVYCFIEISTKSSHNFSTGVWQRKEATKGLARDFFLNFLPKYYDSIISDKTANKLGISFYKKLLDDAISLGYTVTVLNGSHKNEEPYDPNKFDSYWISTDRDVPTHPTFITSKDILFKIYFK